MNSEVKEWYRKNYGVCSKGREQQSWNQPATTICVEASYFETNIIQSEYRVRNRLLCSSPITAWYVLMKCQNIQQEKNSVSYSKLLMCSIGSGITFFPRYASAVSFILPRTMAEISSGANNFSPCDVVTSMWGLLFFSFTCKTIGSWSWNWHLLLNKCQFWVYCRIQWWAPYCQHAHCIVDMQYSVFISHPHSHAVCKA